MPNSGKAISFCVCNLSQSKGGLKPSPFLRNLPPAYKERKYAPHIILALPPLSSFFSSFLPPEGVPWNWLGAIEESVVVFIFARIRKAFHGQLLQHMLLSILANLQP